MPLNNELPEEVIAHGARSLLDGLGLTGFAGLGKSVRDTGPADMQRNLKPRAERLDEREVLVSLAAAQSVVDVDGRQSYAERVARQSVGGVQQEQ